MDLDSLQYLILTPVPGTQFYQEMEAQNRIICRDWSHYDGHHTVFQPRHFTPYELQRETIRAMKRFYSWPSVFKRFIRRDWFYGSLRAYGRWLMWKAHWGKNNYVQQLKANLFDQARKLKQWLPGGASIRRVGIPGDIWQFCPWEKVPREFLLRFLELLGLQVVQEGDEAGDRGPLQAIKDEIARLQEKADLVLLPVWQGLDEARQKLKDLSQDFKEETRHRLLALEFSQTSFYTACMELGLCFQRRLGRIRRAYFQTLAEVGQPV
jgi:hypothetical protein